jgi:hypothetical protein
MGWELDHVFIMTEPGAAAAERLVSLGLVEGSPNVHAGQGTANRRFFFENAMLELLYVTDEATARSALVAPLRLWERSRWRQTHASPCGVCLRGAQGDPPPFTTVAYAPPYLPEGVAIPIARGTLLVEPLVFVNPLGVRPAEAAREPLEHPLAVREVTSVHVASAGCELPSDPLRAVQRLGAATFGPGDGHLLEITFDGGSRSEEADLRPDLPLVLRW